MSRDYLPRDFGAYVAERIASDAELLAGIGDTALAAELEGRARAWGAARPGGKIRGDDPGAGHEAGLE